MNLPIYPYINNELIKITLQQYNIENFKYRRICADMQLKESKWLHECGMT